MLHNIIVYIDVDIETKYDILLLKQKEIKKILDNLNINDNFDEKYRVTITILF